MGDEALMRLGGARHKAARKLLAPPFHGARMRTYAEVMRTIAVDEARGWRPGVPIDPATWEQLLVSADATGLGRAEFARIAQEHEGGPGEDGEEVAARGA